MVGEDGTTTMRTSPGRSPVAGAMGGIAASFRRLVLPTEHGSWSMALEPVLLGLLAAPSAEGFGLGAAAFLAFLSRRPLRSAVRRRDRGSLLWLVLLAASSLLCAAPFALIHGSALWLAFLGAPAAALFLREDLRLHGRLAFAEVAAAAAFAFVPSAFVVASGRPATLALVAGGLMASRGIAAVLLVRTRLRLDRGRPASPAVAVLAHVPAVLLGLFAALAGYAPGWLVGAPLLLLARAGGMIAPRRPRLSIPQIGITEIVFGVAHAAWIATTIRLTLPH